MAVPVVVSPIRRVKWVPLVKALTLTLNAPLQRCLGAESRLMLFLSAMLLFGAKMTVAVPGLFLQGFTLHTRQGVGTDVLRMTWQILFLRRLMESP